VPITRYVAFLRAINVAGHGSVRMNEVREAFATAGCQAVSTCIQSGNVLFELPSRRSKAMLEAARGRLGAMLGHKPDVVLRTLREVQQLVENCPFSGLPADRDSKRYIVFLARKPRIRPALPLTCPQEGVEAVTMSDREVFVVSRRKSNGFFGFPNAFVETQFGVLATSRNWSTVIRVVETAQRSVRS